MLRLPEITYKDVVNVHWPVYVLPNSTELRYEDGVLWAEGRVVDDRNQTGDTLGVRRLKSPLPLAQLRRGLENLSQLVAGKNNKFIDRRGNLFKYKRTINATVKYKKIRRIDSKDIASLLWVDGEDTSIPIPRPPPEGYRWVGIVYIADKFPSLVYDYSPTKQPDIRKRL
jgi:hypothetical protein